jgi:hypothetical protein
VREFVPDDVDPHWFWQQQKNANPAGRTREHRHPGLIGAATAADDEPQRAKRAEANREQNDCDDEFDPLGHGDRIQKLEFRS